MFLGSWSVIALQPVKRMLLLLDYDECKSDEHKCVQNCINTVGSYRCSCNLGYTLNRDGYNCTGMCFSRQGTIIVPNMKELLLGWFMSRQLFLLEYKVVFKSASYRKNISKTIPKYTLVLTVNAFAEGVNKPIKYSLIRKYPKPTEIGSYPFRISPTTG